MAAATRPALTDRQRTVLAELVAYIGKHGYPPTVRELGPAVGLSSTQSVRQVLVALEEKGYLRRVPGSPRAIQLLPGNGEAR